MSEPAKDDAFDALLDDPGRSPVGAPVPSASPPHAHGTAELAVEPSSPVVHAHEAAPTFGEFARGWDLYEDPVLCGALAGAALGLLGVFVVLRRAVFVTAAITQGAGLGVALAFLVASRFDVAIPPVFAAFALGLLASSLVGLRADGWMPRETIVGAAYLVASAAAVLVGSAITQDVQDVASILYGTAVLVRPEDLRMVAFTFGVVVVAVVTTYRGMVFAGFDPEGARVQRIPVAWLDSLLWFLIALEVAVAARALGALPVFALAVLPALAALLVARRLPTVLVLSAALGAVAAAAGYVVAFLKELPVGATQAALAASLLVPAFAVRKVRGG